MQDRAHGFKLTHLSQADQAALRQCDDSPAMVAEQVYESLMQDFQAGAMQGFQSLDTDPDITGFHSWALEQATGSEQYIRAYAGLFGMIMTSVFYSCCCKAHYPSCV